MNTCNVLNAFFLSNPVYRGMAEKIILVATGVCGLFFSWKRFPIFPFSHMFGGVLIILAYGFHWWAHKKHKQAHEEASEIRTIVTTGIFSKIRHPLYLSLLAMNVGIAIAFGVMITFALALLTIVHWVLTALKEEEALIKRFPAEYTRYNQQVRWRMIPWIF
jgi:protein-S-isoprenylcysteine O-methyltransferase Ste14